MAGCCCNLCGLELAHCWLCCCRMGMCHILQQTAATIRLVATLQYCSPAATILIIIYTIQNFFGIQLKIHELTFNYTPG